jgi:hypothetical protein
MEAFGAACRREYVSLEAQKSPRVRCIHAGGKQYRRGRIVLPSLRGKRHNFPLTAISRSKRMGVSVLILTQPCCPVYPGNYSIEAKMPRIRRNPNSGA